MPFDEQKFDEFCRVCGFNLDAWQRRVIVAAMRETNGNKRQAAIKLGLYRATLYNKLRNMRISEKEYLHKG